MAGASADTLSEILKNVYRDGLYADEVRHDTAVLSRMEKSKIPFEGATKELLIHVAESDSFMASNDGRLPIPEHQTYKRIHLETKRSYATFGIESKIMDLAAKSKGSFMGWKKAELDPLEKTSKDRMEAFAVSGGRVIGFLNEHKAGAAPDTWQFTGDTRKLQKILTAKGAPVLCRFVRLDSSLDPLDSVLAYSAIGADINISAVNQALKTVVIDAALDTTGVSTGFAVAVVVVDAHPSLNDFAFKIRIDSQPFGFYTQLASQAHFGLSRDSSVGAINVDNFPSLQSTMLTQNTAGTHARAVMTDFSVVEKLRDLIWQKTGEEPDVLLINSAMRRTLQTVVAGLGGAFVPTEAKQSGTASVGFKRFSYLNMMFEETLQVPDGMILAMKDKSWEYHELTPYHLEDRDGQTIRQVAGYDKWEGFFVTDYQHLCGRPRCQGMITGITLAV